MTTPLTTSLSPDMLEANAFLFLQNLESDLKLKQQWESLLADIKNQLVPNQADSYTTALLALDNFIFDAGYPTNASTVLALAKQLEAQQDGHPEPNVDSERFVQDLLLNADLEMDWLTAVNLTVKDGKADALEECLKEHQYHCNAAQVRASLIQARQKNLLYWTGIYGAGFLTFKTGNDFSSEPAPILMVYGNNQVALGIEKLDWELHQMSYSQGTLTWMTDEFGTVLHSGKITFNQVMMPTQDDPYVGNEYFGVMTFSPEHPDYPGKTATIMGRVGQLADSPSTQPLTRNFSDPPANPKPQTPPTIDVQILDWIKGRIGFPVTCTIGAVLLVVVTGLWIWKVRQMSQQAQEAIAVKKLNGIKDELQREFNSQSTEIQGEINILNREIDRLNETYRKLQVIAQKENVNLDKLTQDLGAVLEDAVSNASPEIIHDVVLSTPELQAYKLNLQERLKELNTYQVELKAQQRKRLTQIGNIKEQLLDEGVPEKAIESFLQERQSSRKPILTSNKKLTTSPEYQDPKEFDPSKTEAFLKAQQELLPQTEQELRRTTQDITPEGDYKIRQADYADKGKEKDIEYSNLDPTQTQDAVNDFLG